MKKALKIIIAIVILAGILMTIFLGLNYDLPYEKNIQINMDMGSQFSNKEIRDLVEEVMHGRRFMVEKIEVYQDQVSIVLPFETTDEEITQIVDKINGKYDLNFKYDPANEGESTVFKTVFDARIRGRDIIVPYIAPIIIATVLVLIYSIVIDSLYFKGTEDRKLTGRMLVNVIVVLGLYLGVIAICRIPVSRYVVPVGLGLYALTVLFTTATTLRGKELPQHIKNKFKD